MGHEQMHGIVVRDERFEKRMVAFHGAAATGRAILAAAGVGPLEEYVVLQHLPSGELEDVRPDESVDLAAGSREFFVIRGSEMFAFYVNQLSLRWPRGVIGGCGIRFLARVGDDHELVQVREGHGEKVIEPDDEVRIEKAGVERFVTRPRLATIIVNGRQKRVPLAPISFEAVVALAFENPPTGDGVQFTVQYTRGPEQNPSGALVEGQSVMVRNGMEFDVTSTNRS